MTISKLEDMELLLSILDKQQLCGFIREECINDRYLMDRFLALGAGTIYTPKSTDYQRRIKEIISDFEGRDGFVSYNRTFDLNRAISRIIDEADAAMSNQQWEVAVSVLEAVATTGEDIIYCGDDSAGELGDIVRQCFEKWYELSIDDSLPPTMRSKIFELSLTHFAEGCLKGFDWWWDWVQIAILLADTPDKQERVMNELNSIIDIDGDDWDVKYNRETAQRYKLELISRCGTRDEQYKFMCENVGNPNFRRRLLQIAWDAGDYDEVVRLAEDGAVHDSQLRGLVNEWHKWELKVYRHKNDSSNIIRLARYFFFNGGGFGEKEYDMENMYAQMKALLPNAEWNGFVETLLKEAAGGRHDYRMLFIYSQEKMWDRYRDYLRKSPVIHELDDAPEEVWELYKDELIQLYTACVKNFFQRASSRNSYCEGVSMLRKLINYGGRTEVSKIINEQKARIPRRPALIDELSKFEKEL